MSEIQIQKGYNQSRAPRFQFRDGVIIWDLRGINRELMCVCEGGVGGYDC